MPHAWESNVVGGVAEPRFVLCDGSAQLIANGDLEVNADGWTYSGTRVADPLTPFGDYVYQIDGDLTVTYTIPVAGSLADRTFALSVFVRGTESSEIIHCGVNDPAEDHPYTMTEISNTEYKQYVYVFTWASYQTASSFKVQFYTAGTLQIDRVRCWEVTNDITTMPLASEDSYEFLELRQARTTKADQTITDYVLGYRFTAGLKYDFLTAQQEVYRTQISEADLVLFRPHTDTHFVATCRWDESRYRRRYFHNRYLGHVGAIELIGLDLLPGKPVEIKIT